jgi:hypothetical protein
MFFGMENGTFAGKKFADYFADVRGQGEGHAIINPATSLSLVAGYAIDHYAGISYTTG